jgi:hypothetical protein
MASAAASLPPRATLFLALRELELFASAAHELQDARRWDEASVYAARAAEVARRLLDWFAFQTDVVAEHQQQQQEGSDGRFTQQQSGGGQPELSLIEDSLDGLPQEPGEGPVQRQVVAAVRTDFDELRGRVECALELLSEIMSTVADP